MKYTRDFAGELLGTFLLVLFGCGTVANSVLFDTYPGIGELAYILAPIIGAVLAGLLFTRVLQKLMKMPKEESCSKQTEPNSKALDR